MLVPYTDLPIVDGGKWVMNVLSIHPSSLVVKNHI